MMANVGVAGQYTGGPGSVVTTAATLAPTAPPPTAPSNILPVVSAAKVAANTYKDLVTVSYFPLDLHINSWTMLILYFKI